MTKNNINNNEIDFINIYAKSILEDLGILDNNKEYEKLLKIVKDRINARVYLEMIAMLTPEQVKNVSLDIDNDNGDPIKTIKKIIEQVPDFQPRMAIILNKIRSELLEDFKVLSNN